MTVKYLTYPNKLSLISKPQRPSFPFKSVPKTLLFPYSLPSLRGGDFISLYGWLFQLIKTELHLKHKFTTGYSKNSCLSIYDAQVVRKLNKLDILKSICLLCDTQLQMSERVRAMLISPV